MKKVPSVPAIIFQQDKIEFETEERCFITESSNDENDPEVSIAKARVEPGVRTAWHQLTNTAERYIIISGNGIVELDYSEGQIVKQGDIVRIPQGIPQRIHNTGKVDLIFYCICSPRFQAKNYVNLE